MNGIRPATVSLLYFVRVYFIWSYCTEQLVSLRESMTISGTGFDITVVAWPYLYIIHKLEVQFFYTVLRDRVQANAPRSAH